MIGAKLRVDTKGVQAAFGKLPAGIPKAMQELRKPLRVDQREHARAQEGPDGPWPKRASAADRASASRKRRKRRRPSRRRLLGKLPGAVKVTSTRSSVTIESRVAWSGIHQHGGTAGRGAKIPARPFLWISQKLRGIAIATLEQRMAEAFMGGR